MKLSAFLDEIINIEAARLAAYHELRARLTAENAEDAGDIPFEAPPQRQAKQTPIDTVMGAHIPTSPARSKPENHYRCKCSLPAARYPATGFIEKEGKKPWAAFKCPKDRDDPGKCDYWEFDPTAPKAETGRRGGYTQHGDEPEPDWTR